MNAEAPRDVVLTVDRAGGRGTVVVQDDHEREASLPVAWFPKKPNEGDVFRLRLEPDESLRDQRRASVAALSDRLDQGTGPDDVETL